MVMGKDSCTDKEEGRRNQQGEAPKGDPSELTFTRRLELVTDSWESQTFRGEGTEETKTDNNNRSSKRSTGGGMRNDLTAFDFYSPIWGKMSECGRKAISDDAMVNRTIAFCFSFVILLCDRGRFNGRKQRQDKRTRRKGKEKRETAITKEKGPLETVDMAQRHQSETDAMEGKKTRLSQMKKVTTRFHCYKKKE